MYTFERKRQPISMLRKFVCKVLSNRFEVGIAIATGTQVPSQARSTSSIAVTSPLGGTITPHCESEGGAQ
jgi:hypothetical protein